jgi:RNA polymerase-binding transcription factor DksA
MLHDVRERHPLAAGGMDMEDRVQADLPRELDASLLEKEAEARQLVEDALRRSEQGDHERCTRCGEPIGRARRRGVPFTAVCRACKDAEEKGMHPEVSPRPIPITP